jgi:selenocysteine-specific elongation factor
MTGHFTLGVIGHVDHGKTALVRALTGIETDRLKEEQERGLSIVLGFSYLESSDGVIDLIDVPGHEDFIRTMISGATGIDGVLLIVAANEGVMPQTREHFDIAQLLGVERGLIVLTKTDLLTCEEVEFSEEEIREYVAGSFLDGAPVIRTSALRGEGLDDLRTALGQLEARVLATETSEGFFLPVDRVFAMQGFGAVVTGTLRSGVLTTNENVEILPGGETATVRGLQNHNQAVEAAYPGQRVAVNLRNLKREEFASGDVLASPGFLKVTRRLDVELELLGHLKDGLKNGTAVRVLFGTTEVIAKLRLLDQATLQPGSTGLVQLRCQRDVTTHRSERFIIRNISPVFTVGGGRILDVDSPRHRRFDDSVTNRLRSIAEGDTTEMVRSSLAEAGLRGADMEDLRGRLGISVEGMKGAIADVGAIEVGAHRIIERSVYSELKDKILALLERTHEENSREQGLPLGSIPGQLDLDIEEGVLKQAVNELVVGGEVQNDTSILSLKGFDALGRLPEVERRVAAELEQIFLSGGITPPPLDTALQRDGMKRDVYRLLSETGTLVRLKTYDRNSNFVFHRDVLRDIKERLQERFPYPSEFAVSEVRDLLVATRKYVVPLLEHLDATGVTIRTGNVRRLRDH